MDKTYIMNARGNSKNLFTLAYLARENIKRGVPMSNEALDFLRRVNMSTGIVGGYPSKSGFMGYVDGKYEWFESEQAYYEFIKEKSNE